MHTAQAYTDPFVSRPVIAIIRLRDIFEIDQTIICFDLVDVVDLQIAFTYKRRHNEAMNGEMFRVAVMIV